jgi:hypothetical protein
MCQFILHKIWCSCIQRINFPWKLCFLLKLKKTKLFHLGGREGIGSKYSVNPHFVFLSFLASVFKPGAPFLFVFWEGDGQWRLNNFIFFGFNEFWDDPYRKVCWSLVFVVLFYFPGHYTSDMSRLFKYKFWWVYPLMGHPVVIFVTCI